MERLPVNIPDTEPVEAVTDLELERPQEVDSVGMKVQEKLNEAAAMRQILGDPEAQQVYMAGQLAEAEMGATVQANAAAAMRRREQEQLDRARKDPEQGWGISYLARRAHERRLSDIYHQLSEARKETEKSTASYEERDEAIDEKVWEARQLTLTVGRQVARRVEGSVEPDVEIHEIAYRKKYGKRLGIIPSKKKYTYEEYMKPTGVKGWSLQVGKTQLKVASTILTTDGRIISGIPNPAWTKAKEDGTGRDLAFKVGNYRELDTDYESDIAAPTIPDNSRLAAAETIFRREEDLQNSLTNLLVTNGLAPTERRRS